MAPISAQKEPRNNPEYFLLCNIFTSTFLDRLNHVAYLCTPVQVSLSPPSQGTLNHTSGYPVAFSKALKQCKILLTQLHFPYYVSGQWRSPESCLNSYLYPPLYIILSHPSQGTLIYSSEGPVAPIKTQTPPKIHPT